MNTDFPRNVDLGRAVAETLPEASSVYLFGSLVMGAANSSSDVDLAILASGPIAIERLVRARESLAERLRRDIDLLDLSRASTVMRAHVISTGQLLRDADPSFRLQFEMTTCSAYARLNEERRGIVEQIQTEGRVHGR